MKTYQNTGILILDKISQKVSCISCILFVTNFVYYQDSVQKRVSCAWSNKNEENWENANSLSSECTKLSELNKQPPEVFYKKSCF